MFTLIVIFTEFRFVFKLHFYNVPRLENRHLVKPVPVLKFLHFYSLLINIGRVSQVGH